MSIFTDILTPIYAATAQTVTWTPAATGVPVDGLAQFNGPGSVIVGGEMLATDYGLRFAASTFPAVKRGDAFTVDGVGYVARESAQPLLDGAEMHVPLAKA
jgi:hypothetical protein